jgi:hypothetical protein
MKKVKKKSRNACAARNAQRHRNDVRRTTFYMHGTMMGSLGSEVGNPKHHISIAQANEILDRKNTWAIMILVFIDTGFEQGTKTLIDAIKAPLTRTEINKIIDDTHWSFVDKQNLNQVCSSGFFLVPDHTVDLEKTQRDIIKLFELHKPWDRDHTANATLIRHLQEELEAA